MGVPSFIEDEIYKAVQNRHAIERVRQLHKPYLAISGQTVCEECWDGEYNKDNFPCDTIKALDGEQ